MLGNKALVKISSAIASVNSLRETQPPAAGLKHTGSNHGYSLGQKLWTLGFLFIFARNMHHTHDGERSAGEALSGQYCVLKQALTVKES